jgi:hypothetical protein
MLVIVVILKIIARHKPPGYAAGAVSRITF